jgi:2-keto-3-deoxy-L-rhamnonate aldolase RhmA
MLRAHCISIALREVITVFIAQMVRLVSRQDWSIKQVVHFVRLEFIVPMVKLQQIVLKAIFAKLVKVVPLHMLTFPTSTTPWYFCHIYSP